MTLFRVDIPKQLIILVALASGLVLTRVAFTGSTYYLYLLWNIFLALLPFIISAVVLYNDEKKRLAVWLLVIFGIIWLAFFPNAPYLLTDVIHLRKSQLSPIWYDALMFFSIAWVGILCSLYSLSHFEKIVRARFSNFLVWSFIVLAIFLTSFGIYVGRFLRWNSWDVIANTNDLATDIWSVFYQPAQHQQAYLLIPVFTIFIIISYIAWRDSNV